MEPNIRTLKEKKLIGYHLKMSIINNKTGMLWGKFAPRIKEIKNKVDTNKFSMQVYDASYFETFNPTKEFEKWAAVEVSSFDEVPDDLETYNLIGGEYAVFHYKGSNTESFQFFEYIFKTWLPNSDYQLDHRPHFELLGDKYKNNDVNSEEEVWIPIKRK